VIHLSSLPGRRYVWRSAVVNAESEVTITEQEMARVEAALDEHQPPESPSWRSVPEVIERPLIARPISQWAASDNVLLQIADGTIHLTERPQDGYHRLLMRIEDGRADSVVTASLLAKPMGRTTIKLELHDDEVKQYATSTFDLDSGEEWLPEGSVEQSAISPMQDGYFKLSLSLRLTVDSAIHFSLSLLDSDNATVYAGDQKRGVLVRKLDIRR
jgi:hypothetical protein